MTTYVALLYSIVLGPGRRVIMSDLRDMAVDLGLANPRTLVATGNLVFEAEGKSVATLERELEAAFAQKFGKHVDIIVRDAAAWLKLVAANPFPEESEREPDQVGVRVMREPVTPDVIERLLPYVAADERLTSVDGDIWIYFSRSAGSSRLLGALTPKRAGGIGTSRNWNTVRRLGDMVAS
ncbi:uncharacterized protein (DUF1697 family) [Aminobacter niigataensis]|uniref:Uncharacterized protein (DUF1697 family) n=1 Tax=Aminobacter niigataensis TaxID=83265 RepID=A0ABR6KXD5_9HYPH|nr:DUF1697 domain-containing protein [Aminobacter niigataensis]MBB4649152.1 uncharacterized protein (DUF1697 family) [Aminobacter niigataensis]